MRALWAERLERRFGGWEFEHLASFLTAMNGAVFLLSLLRPEFPALLGLDPQAMLRGELWRALTFLFVPPAISPFWMLFWLYLFFLYARALEEAWGHFHFNLFYLLGALSVLLASLATGTSFSNVPLNTSLFLAFSALFPETELLFFFVLPVQVRLLGLLAWAALLWTLLTGPLIAKANVASGVLNYALFFGPAHWSWLKPRLKAWLGRASKP